MWNRPFACSVFGVLLVSAAFSPLMAGARGQAGVLWKGTFSFVDERDFSLFSAIKVPKGDIGVYWHSHDESRLNLLITDKDTSTITSIDVKERALIGAREISAPLASWVRADPEKDLFMIFREHKKEESFVLRVGVDSAEIEAKTPLSSMPYYCLLTPQQSSLVLAFEAEGQRPSRMESLDTGSLKTRGSIDFPGRIRFLFADHADHNLYVLSESSGAKNGAGNGVLSVMKPESLELLSSSAVLLEGGVLWDEGSDRLYVFGKERQGGGESFILNVFSEGHVQHSLPLGGTPVGVTLVEGGQDALVFEEDRVTIVDQDSLKVKARVLLTEPPASALASSRSSTAYVRHANSAMVTAFDRESGAVQRTFAAGRSAVRFWTAFAGVMNIATLNPTGLANMMFSSGQRMGGQPDFFSPHGDRAFLMDRRTNDVTVVDTKTNTLIDKVPGGDLAQMSSDGRYLFTSGGGFFRMFETASLRKVLGFEVPPGTKLYLSEDESYGYVQTVRPHVWPVELGSTPRLIKDRRYTGHLVLLRPQSMREHRPAGN